MENKERVKVVSVLIALVVSGFVGYQLGQRSEPEMVTKVVSEHSGMTMDEMTAGLSGLSGDTFDRAFVEMMIVHHQGAVDMAALIPANAKHEELKKLGQDIVAAQTKEIAMMQQWLKDWGYSAASEKTEDGRTGMGNDTMSGMQHEDGFGKK